MTDLESVFTTLFAAPSRVVVEADARYRQIWMEWLNNLKNLMAARQVVMKEDLTPAQQKMLIENQMNLAPVMKLDGKIEVAITMRLASVSKKEGNVSLGLGVGAFQVSGGFGMSSQTTQESVLQARAMYGMSNAREMSLGEYLKSFSIEVTDATTLDKAVSFLSTPVIAANAKK